MVLVLVRLERDTRRGRFGEQAPARCPGAEARNRRRRSSSELLSLADGELYDVGCGAAGGHCPRFS
jgi:hypothetical protein